jgi:hypothetical protein
MPRRLVTEDVINFAERHRISLDWLLACELKGLLRMVRTRAAV